MTCATPPPHPARPAVGAAMASSQVVHDLRSPLFAAANVATALDAMPGATRLDSPDAITSVVSLKTSTRTMQTVISDLVSFERVTSGEVRMRESALDLDQLLRAARGKAEDRAARAGIRFQTAPVPPELSRLSLVGDADILAQCIERGVSNALRFTANAGAVTLRVEPQPAAPGGGEVISPPGRDLPTARRRSSARQVLPTARSGSWSSASYATGRHGRERPRTKDSAPLVGLRIVVEDSGCGIEARELKVLNGGEPFAQVGKGQLEGSGGTGLGLTIARQFLALHNGSSLAIESEGIGRGARFVMHVRARELDQTRYSTVREDDEEGQMMAAAVEAEATAAAAEEDTTRAPVQSAATTSPQPPADPRPEWIPDTSRGPAVRILHAEDDLVVHLTLSLVLFKPIGVDCVHAQDGSAAVDLILGRGEHFDLIIMDNQMPNMSGTEATRQLRAGGFTGRIIGVTGDPVGCDDRMAFDNSGVDEVLDKDSQGTAVLRERLHALVGGGRAVPGSPPDHSLHAIS